jgi:hypothetical protein
MGLIGCGLMWDVHRDHVAIYLLRWEREVGWFRFSGHSLRGQDDGFGGGDECPHAEEFWVHRLDKGFRLHGVSHD